MKIKYGWAGVLVALSIASCGGDGPGLAGGRSGDGGTGTGGDPDATVVMGSTTDGSFQEGVLGVGATNLSSGGSTSLTVQLRDGTGAAYTESVDVTFSSDCQSAGRADISEPVVTTTVGTATTTYNDLGCPGSDTITARASVGGAVLTATGALTVAEASLGSIEFISAEPQTIGLKGTGAAGIRETSTVKFRVLNDVGGPMPDQTVNFALSTSAGGLNLAAASAVSGSDGTVSVIVRSGTIPISVRVTATVDATNVSTQSSALTVSTAIPDQNSFSLAAETYNPEAWNIDGVIVPLTVLAADRFNNLVPDDTAIVFTTELGAIVAQCLTIDGGCTVNWRSQAPRTSPDNNPLDTGRTTILAHAIGEESFYDDDGDGVFDGNTVCTDPPAAGADCYFDLPEAWLDNNENGVRNSPTEPYVDFDSDNTYDGANGEWNGIVCGGEDCEANLVNVRGSVTLVMARTFADILFFDNAGNRLASGDVVQTGQAITTCVAGFGTFVPANPATLAAITQAQTMPAGTTVEFAAAVGELAGKTDFVIPNTASQSPRCYTMRPTASDPATGALGPFEVTVITPSGEESYDFLDLDD